MWCGNQKTDIFQLDKLRKYGTILGSLQCRLILTPPPLRPPSFWLDYESYLLCLFLLFSNVKELQLGLQISKYLSYWYSYLISFSKSSGCWYGGVLLSFALNWQLKQLFIVIKKITGVIIKWFSLRVFRQKNSSDLFNSLDDYWSGLACFVSMTFIQWDLDFLTVTCWVDVQYVYVVMPFPWLEGASRNDSVWQCLLETYLQFDDYGK